MQYEGGVPMVRLDLCPRVLAPASSLQPAQASPTPGNNPSGDPLALRLPVVLTRRLENTMLPQQQSYCATQSLRRAF